MWVVAPGLKNPALHAGVQMKTKGDVFWGGLAKVSTGLLVGISGWAALSWAQWNLWRRTVDGIPKKKDSDLDCTDCSELRKRYSEKKGRCIMYCKQDVAHRIVLEPIALIAMLVLLLFTTGSWSPLTNLIYCAVGSTILAPPGGRRIDPKVLMKKRAKIIAERGIPSHTANTNANDGNLAVKSPSRRPPNVIVVVHESLGGAALESKRGQDAAPFWHNTLKSDPDFYAFQNGRATAGVTPVATPAILTGLLPYEDKCLAELQAANLGHEFSLAGYDTGSFVSYDHNWAGGAWSIIEDMVKPGFDFLAGPTQTGEPVVNEYGMDDRVLMRYLRRWMRDRDGTALGMGATADNQEESAETVATFRDQRNARSLLRGAEGDVGINSAPTANGKPFFALVVFNNNHFPHLVHESYTGLPPECFENTTDDAEEDCENRIPDADDWEEDRGNSNDLLEGDESGLYNEDRIGSDDCNNWYRAKKYYYINGEMYDCEGDVGHYYSSMRTMDESLQSLFASLEELGELNNTIVVGAGDHGETPNTLKRLNDVDAPILQVPIWMRVPRELLPESAFITDTGFRSNVTHTNHTHSRPDSVIDKDRPTHLRSNINRTVSVLDIMPTLREILNYTNAYTQDERRLCVTGSSLLSRTLHSKRIVPGWQGPPLQPGQKTGIFMTRSEALVHYEGVVAESHVAEFRFDDEDPIFKLFERHSADWTVEERKSWTKALLDGGWLEGGRKSGLVSRRMPKLLDDVLSQRQTDEDENVEDGVAGE